MVTKNIGKGFVAAVAIDVFHDYYCHNYSCLGRSCPLFSMSRLPLPLSDCVGVLVALGGKDVMVTKMLIEGVLTLLMSIMVC